MMRDALHRAAMPGLLWCLLLPGAQNQLRAQTKELAVSPAEQPSPALRYRLLPLSSLLTPGNAAPVYLRLRSELEETSWKEMQEKAAARISVPLAELPIADTRNLVNEWAGKLKLLKIGTRREHCDWGYPIAEQRQEIIEIVMPDCQDMRQWARLLALKARVETAEHDYDQALDTIETGMALGRHVGQGPFLINNMVGIAIGFVMVDRVEELIAQPGAPNLYWALTALPQPLVSMRQAFELEQQIAENLIPELTRTDEPHTRAEWGVLVEKLYDRLRHLAERITSDKRTNEMMKSLLYPDVASFKKEILASSSREYLSKSRHLTVEQIAAMPEDEVIARALVAQFQYVRDELYKYGYLPWREARTHFDEAENVLKSVKPGPLKVLAGLQSSVLSCLEAQAKFERRIAALRVVEAIRLHAAAHGGNLPQQLSEIASVPVPDDPATGKPFEYHRDKDAAVVTLPAAGMKGKPLNSYRITIRK